MADERNHDDEPTRGHSSFREARAAGGNSLHGAASVEDFHQDDSMTPRPSEPVSGAATAGGSAVGAVIGGAVGAVAGGLAGPAGIVAGAAAGAALGGASGAATGEKVDEVEGNRLRDPDPEAGDFTGSEPRPDRAS